MFNNSIRRSLLISGLFRASRNVFNHTRYPLQSRGISQTTASVYTGGKLPLGIFLTGYSIWSYKALEKKNKKRKEAEREEEFLAVPPKRFNHPHNNSSWFFKFYIFAKRYAYLTLLFTPVTVLFLLSGLTGNETIYSLSLDTLAYTLSHAGCGLQKFAQWISMRPDKFHPDLVNVAGRFREDAPSHSLAVTKQIFQDNFGKDLDDIFEWFDEIPLASGTIAQVHRATLREEYVTDPEASREVAVKIRHKHVKDQSYTDPPLIFNFCEATFALFATILPFDRKDFCHSMARQIDLAREAYNMVKFKKNFEDDPDIIFPKVYTQLCCDEVLVETFCRGEAVGDMMDGFDQEVYGYHFTQDIQYSKEYRSGLADKICKLGVNMYLRDNFAHADLHAGNLMATKDGKLIVLDTGIVTNVEDTSIEKFHEMLESGFRQDHETFVDVLMHFNISDKPVDRKSLVDWVKSDMAFYQKDGVMNFGAFYGNILHALDSHKMELQGDVATSIVNMGVMEGMIRSLDADYDLATRVVPFFLERKTKNKFNFFNFSNSDSEDQKTVSTQ